MEEKRLAQEQIANGSQTTLYTLAANTTAIFKTIIITNTTSSDATVSIWDVKDGDSYGDSNAIVNDLNVPANDFVQIITYLIQDTEGDALKAEAGTASAITINAYGAEI